MKRIDDNYIFERYNLDKERKTVYQKTFIKDLELDSEITGEYTVKVYKEYLNKLFNNFHDDDLIECNYYGYDSGYEIHVFRNLPFMETNREVLERLKIFERAQRKLNKPIIQDYII